MLKHVKGNYKNNGRQVILIKPHTASVNWAKNNYKM